MEHVIVERVFAEPLSVEEVEAALARGKGCMVAHRVSHVRTTLSLDGRRTICEYLAPDAETVRRVSERLGVPYERVWTARVIAPKGETAGD